MPTTLIRVAAGATSDVIPMTPQRQLCVGPAVLGGSVLVETSTDGRTGWTRWSPGTITQGGSLYMGNAAGFARVTATTQNANAFMVDFSGANSPNIDQFVNVNNVLASANATTEQILLSFRTPAGFLPTNFAMQIALSISLTNNVNVKTLRLRVGGVGGTALFTSPSLASQVNYNAIVGLSGRGDGVSLIGFGPGASGGIGVSTTAYATATQDYLNNETEWVITGTKATGTDTMQVESAVVQIF